MSCDLLFVVKLEMKL